MHEYRYRATCHTKCYWLENLWQPGEIYEGDLKPIKHFSEDGKIDPELPPDDAGSDPRSTKEIRLILERTYGSEKPKSWSRKKLWAALHEFETADGRDELLSPGEGNDFVAACGFVSKSRAGVAAHERQCSACKGE